MRRLAKVPNKVAEALKNLAAKGLEALKEAWWTEPAVVRSAAVSGLVGIAAALGLPITTNTAGLIVSLVIPLLLGVTIRTAVKPATRRPKR